ncbi:MAG: ATP-binding protein [Oscillospiraceae bacterium]|jgi:DNA replication protein DnaC|nr:ATP-binding protein [Oscillospiraceae bacterium]
MSLDGKLLALAKVALNEKRRLHDALFELRLERVYALEPRVRTLDAEIRSTMTDLLGAALSHGSADNIEDIRKRNIDLQEKRRSALLGAGFPDGYLDDEYMCPKCRDTGYAGMEVCDCLSELYKNELRESLSNLFKLGSETFDSFDLSYYSDAPAPDTGISPRRTMEIIYETCVEYARKFGNRSMNLFFNGAPGLGKTFLSACIARVVSENGHSVVYDTASSVFAKFEDAKFMRSDDPDEARSEVKRCLECDLLILDDIGTEMTTAFTVSVLYDIINTRLITRRKTIASSNLTLGELRRRYSDQIMSRLEGEYQVLTFRGEDIRLKRNAF